MKAPVDFQATAAFNELVSLVRDVEALARLVPQEAPGRDALIRRVDRGFVRAIGKGLACSPLEDVSPAEAE